MSRTTQYILYQVTGGVSEIIDNGYDLRGAKREARIIHGGVLHWQDPLGNGELLRAVIEVGLEWSGYYIERYTDPNA